MGGWVPLSGQAPGLVKDKACFLPQARPAEDGVVNGRLGTKQRATLRTLLSSFWGIIGLENKTGLDVELRWKEEGGAGLAPVPGTEQSFSYVYPS